MGQPRFQHDATAEKRGLDRTPGTELLIPLRFRLRLKDETYPAEALNYHFKGACLRVDKEAARHLKTARFSQVGLDFYHGNKCLRRFIPFRIAWESLDANGLIGVEFMVPISSFLQRPDRFPSHPHFPPVVTARDPFNANRLLYGKVLNLSANGMLLLSSLTNRHLMPGLVLEGATLSFPGSKPVTVDLRIANLRHDETADGMQIGVAFQDCPKVVRDALSRYLSLLSPMTKNPGRLAKLAENGLLSKQLREGLSFRPVATDGEYEEVLKLRFLAYAAHGKVPEGATWRQQGEGRDREGLLIGSFLNGQLVACMEIRFGAGPLPLKTLALIGRSDVPGVDLKNVVEVNRLAIHPSVQGSDIVLGLFQLVHAILVNRGGLDILIMATDKLSSLYEGIGAKSYGIRIPHPFLKGEHLNLLVLRKDVYLKAKGLNALTWIHIYRQTHREYEKVGLVKRMKLGPIRMVEAAAFGLIRMVQKVNKRIKRRRSA